MRTHAPGPAGQLPITAEMLLNQPSGNLFGLTQNAGMGWEASRLLDPEFLILSTHGGLRGEDGRPIALGVHTGHYEVGLLVGQAWEKLAAPRPSMSLEVVLPDEKSVFFNLGPHPPRLWPESFSACRR